jgi:hypothetical protein
VAEAYRTIPIVPSQWPGLVVRLQGKNQFVINMNNNFRLTPAGGIHGSIADAGIDLFQASGIGPVSKWVDDHIFIRILWKHFATYNTKQEMWHREIMANGGWLQNGSRFWFQGATLPDGQVMEFDEDAGLPFQDLTSEASCSPEDEPFTYRDDDIDHVSDTLSIPWEKSKTVPFGNSVPYLGFIWDLPTWTMAIPPAKKEKYLNVIRQWSSCTTHVPQDIQRLYGKLLHTSLVVPAGHAYLTSLKAMLSTFNNCHFVPHHAPQDTANDLKWWTATLSSPDLS